MREFMNLREFSVDRYPWQSELATEKDRAGDYDARRAIHTLLDDLYRHYIDQVLSDQWNETAKVLPDDGAEVSYLFIPFGNVFDGEYENGVFSSKGGFCDCHDAPYWKSR